MSWDYIWSVILGMAVLNYVLKWLPLAVLTRVNIGPFFRRWLSFIPVSVISCIVMSEVVIPSGNWLIPWKNPFLYAALPTGFAYYKTRSYVVAILIGVGTFALVRNFF